MSAEPECRTLRAGEREAFLELMVAAFGERALFERYLDHDPALGEDDTLVAELDGRLVSSVQIFTREMRLSGETVTLGGIGSVATHPEYEGRGLATRLLERAIGAMERRGMALSLLFTGRTPFYERLGWHALDHTMLVLPPTSDSARTAPSDARLRDFRGEDLEGIVELYEGYSGARDLSTRRSESYWRAQLRFAGTPEERFQVMEAENGPVAYARLIRYERIWLVMEYGRASAEPAADALAALLVAMTPEDAALFLPDTGDGALDRALERRLGHPPKRVAFPERMWRVVDRERLVALAGGGAYQSDRALLEALVCRPGAVYWASDRF